MRRQKQGETSAVEPWFEATCCYLLLQIAIVGHRSKFAWHLFSAKGALSSSACGIAAGCESGRTKALKARINPWLDLVNRAFSARIFRIPESWGVAPGFR
jgi:hypothetical protein